MKVPHTTVELNVGRLIEVRGWHLNDLDHIEAISKGFQALIPRMPEKIVICGDYRHNEIFSLPMAERYVKMLTGANPRVLRSGVVVDEEKVLVKMQFQRMLREAQNAERRFYRNAVDVETWLGEVLTPAEKDRLKLFLA